MKLRHFKKTKFTMNWYNNTLRKNIPGSNQGGGLLILGKNNIEFSEFCIDFDFSELRNIIAQKCRRNLKKNHVWWYQGKYPNITTIMIIDNIGKWRWEIKHSPVGKPAQFLQELLGDLFLIIQGTNFDRKRHNFR